MFLAWLTCFFYNVRILPGCLNSVKIPFRPSARESRRVFVFRGGSGSRGSGFGNREMRAKLGRDLVDKTIRNYKDLEAWQVAMTLVAKCYRITKDLLSSEIFGLTSQIQRAAVSIPANIAEGHTREGTKEFLRYLSIACASLAELETHIQIAKSLHPLNQELLEEALREASRLGQIINGLRRSLRRKVLRKNQDHSVVPSRPPAPGSRTPS